MKKIIIRLVVLTATLVASLSACSLWDENFRAAREGEGEGIVLRFFSDEAFLQTKATTERGGEDRYNENALTSVEYFLYSEQNSDGDAVLHGYLENVRQNAPVSIPMTQDIVNYTLCPNNAVTFYVYAIANHDRIVAAGDTEDLTHTSVAELEALTRDIEFTDDDVSKPQSKFLMATDGALLVPDVKRRNTTVASAKVNLKRVAAKISISVRVAESVTIPNTVTISNQVETRNEVWKPYVDEMTVQLVHGAKTGQVSGLPLFGAEQFSYGAVEFDDQNGESYPYETYVKRIDPNTGQEAIDEDGFVIYDKTVKTGTFYPCESPFYTYPESWEYGTDEEPYLKLMIPWERQEGYSSAGRYYGKKNVQYYYRIYCPATEIDASHAQFLRNNWYKVILNVGILGSETDGGEMIINGQYYVVDWQERDTGSASGGGEETGVNDSDKEAEIKGARYLFVNETSYTLYNQDGVMIPYVTSDPCEIVGFSAKKYTFTGDTKQESTTTTAGDWNIDLSLVTTATGAHIKFEHILNNDISTDNYDVSQYEITFTLRQKDDVDYAKTISIVQYPAIIIDSELNTDGYDDAKHGYVYIDTYNSTTTDAWRRNTTLTGGNNANPNMYIISTSVLSDSDMLIGDPRTTNAYTDSDLVSNWRSTSSRYIDGTNNHRLTNYYPTNSDEAFKNVIAPSFRVASSYGKSQNMSYDNARRRCASYQEDGYPAGRWRIPTMAEVLYITTLSQKEMIPELFTFTRSSALDESYWCASGKIDGVYGTPTYYSGTSGNRYIRCVYDEWYWSDMKLNGVDVSRVDKQTFTWGDIPR